jgi:hypothetical protein
MKTCTHEDVETFEESDEVDGWPTIERFVRCFSCGLIARARMRSGELEYEWPEPENSPKIGRSDGP